jgi:NAD(P)-dependent dehydrogenase (short-subunit alcohol dehydrogenase family)
VNPQDLDSFPAGGLAVVVGASGAIGGALMRDLQAQACFSRVMGFSRSGARPAHVASEDFGTLDICSEADIAAAASLVSATGLPLRLLINASGFLHGEGWLPEKTWRQIDASHMAKSFAVNTIGPALLVKHFLPLLPRQGKAVFATLSARVGSIGDNHLGGWYSYRASKAALNQVVRTAAVELARRQRESLCVALHPGTVSSRMSEAFRKDGLDVRQPEVAASDLLAVMDRLQAADSGGFFDYRGEALPW